MNFKIPGILEEIEQQPTTSGLVDSNVNIDECLNQVFIYAII